MESIAINLVLPLIEQLLPLFGVGGATSTTVGLIIKGLETVIPLIGGLTPAYRKVKTIIEAVKANPATTAKQLTELERLDAESDAAFDAALAAAEAEDAKE